MNQLMISLTVLFFSFHVQSFSQKSESIEKRGMKIQYTVGEEFVNFTMTAPTDGWVAIGLNPENKLAGSSFLIGRVKDGTVEIEDFYTRSPGDVPKVKDLGGKTAVRNISGKENSNNTEIVFDLERFPNSKFHHQLKTGKKFFMHIAYSQDDDFAHHSFMRDKVAITF